MPAGGRLPRPALFPFPLVFPFFLWARIRLRRRSCGTRKSQLLRCSDLKLSPSAFGICVVRVVSQLGSTASVNSTTPESRRLPPVPCSQLTAMWPTALNWPGLQAVRPRRCHERSALELESEVFLPEEFLQDSREGRRVNVREERSARLPLLTEEPAVGKDVIFLTQLFEVLRQSAGTCASSGSSWKH